MTEAEIIHLGIPFGRVTNVLVLKGKNQAFLEMEEEPSAIAMVNYFTNCVAQLRERSVYVQFSNHTSLKTDQTHSNASASAQAALQVGKSKRDVLWLQLKICLGFRQLKLWQVQERARLGGRTRFSGSDACPAFLHILMQIQVTKHSPKHFQGDRGAHGVPGHT